MPERLVLGFDTSAAHCAAALLCGDRIVAAAAEDMGRGQAERLMGLLEEVLRRGGANWSELSRIGVGIGPGNFTGTRIAVAAARGLSLALGIPALGVSALEAAALDTPRPCLAVVTGRAGAIHVQLFGTDATEPPRLCTPDTLPALPRETTVIGPAAEEIAARRHHRAAMPAHPLSEAIARIAATRIPQAGDRPAPLYLRAPDAAPSRDAAPRLLP